MQIEDLYKIYLEYPGIQTDTRKIKPGDIFFALKGPNFNGNDYLQKALELGAAYCVGDEPQSGINDRILIFDDSLETLQQLAKYHRQQFKIPFIAITGSNGKTTTKELVHEVLSAKYKCYTTEGNLNNHIGIPLTILKIKPDAEIAVIEMGANHQKEIEGYCRYALPTHGNITNIGKAHLEGFGGEEGVKKGKGELLVYLRQNGGTAFINNDYAVLIELSAGISDIITYGTSAADYIGEIRQDSGLLEVAITKGADLPSIKTQLVGGYNLPNVLTAVCIGKTFGVPDEHIRTALEQYVPSNSRSQLLQKGTNRIILDAYNANPTSMKAAIENFAKMEGGNKVLVLGGMMELGDASEKEHAQIVETIAKYHWTKVVLAGKDYQQLPAGYLHFNNSAEAAEWYKTQHFEHAQILVKGSRSMQMEKILE
ncbi:UDP-N-acetylmuramoyl-tripeptide--D-alanyl-D-alanine ligase [Ferruginibacter sp. HRS2-29]|uniref:UDP-N-acetylmuramoyl-tripeptide--D-alanyl-D- alanine ligase n=1 Tax=Ferruginibacter sp. HRS2-29 TaxID=2487334 RepID=UPI0020CD8373|nr:UDP-N-acetylmuramoyl-tripeptide--D-alanyl-D-alanine ligase [Ferruginibacter sp. HRS2-29]MCP9751663.1 UDP-N-acetylmuramoyl-tripeptide--D-alanyl-D-alanine ligase [Ferruginibacter sp. HRS2-29]